jgi:hypothetical protein
MVMELSGDTIPPETSRRQTNFNDFGVVNLFAFQMIALYQSVLLWIAGDQL